MTDMRDTIRIYEESCGPLRKRIGELNARIAGHGGPLPGESVKSLVERRYLLYCELAQMRWSIHEMREYLRPNADSGGE